MSIFKVRINEFMHLPITFNSPLMNSSGTVNQESINLLSRNFISFLGTYQKHELINIENFGWYST